MAAEATYRGDGCAPDFTPDAATLAGEVVQLKDGRAAVVPTDVASGALGAARTKGVWRLLKTAAIAILNGGRVYFDHSANKAHYKKVNDRDFYVGRAVGDSSESDTTVDVELNIDPAYDIDMLAGEGGFLSVPTGTQAVGAFGFPKRFGRSVLLELTATSEPQCVDMLSVDRFAVASNPIAEFVFRPAVNGSGAAVDFNVGIASGTSTSDADAIAESVFAHIDGASTAINAESDDGTTEVNATDTTKVITAGSAVANRTEVWIDARDPADVQVYVDGVNVLPNSAFVLTAAAGPLALLAHLEKTTGTTTAQFYVDRACVRLGQQ
jgi:predicted RecA/RadA family phage recombinase